MVTHGDCSVVRGTMGRFFRDLGVQLWAVEEEADLVQRMDLIIFEESWPGSIEQARLQRST